MYVYVCSPPTPPAPRQTILAKFAALEKASSEALARLEAKLPKEPRRESINPYMKGTSAATVWTKAQPAGAGGAPQEEEPGAVPSAIEAPPTPAEAAVAKSPAVVTPAATMALSPSANDPLPGGDGPRGGGGDGAVQASGQAAQPPPPPAAREESHKTASEASATDAEGKKPRSKFSEMRAARLRASLAQEAEAKAEAARAQEEAACAGVGGGDGDEEESRRRTEHLSDDDEEEAEDEDDDEEEPLSRKTAHLSDDDDDDDDDDTEEEGEKEEADLDAPSGGGGAGAEVMGAAEVIEAADAAHLAAGHLSDDDDDDDDVDLDLAGDDGAPSDRPASPEGWLCDVCHYQARLPVHTYSAASNAFTNLSPMALGRRARAHFSLEAHSWAFALMPF